MCENKEEINQEEVINNEQVVEEKQEVEEDKKQQFLNSLEEMNKDELISIIKDAVNKTEELNKQVLELTTQSLKYKDSWIRTSADFDNFRKRNQDTRMNAYKDGKIDAIKSLLVVGDNLDRALLLELDAKTKEGIEMTAKRFAEILEGMGVTSINPISEEFNPQTMEAVLTSPKEEGEESGKVKQVFLKGYKLGDKVIRYAQVVVIG